MNLFNLKYECIHTASDTYNRTTHIHRRHILLYRYLLMYLPLNRCHANKSFNMRGGGAETDAGL